MPSRTKPVYPDNLSECLLRLTLEDRHFLNFKTGDTFFKPTLKVEYWAGEDGRGRDKWKPALPGVLAEIAGVDSPTNADLLEAMARILRHQANGRGPLDLGDAS